MSNNTTLEEVQMKAHIQFMEGLITEAEVNAVIKVCNLLIAEEI